MHLRHLVPALGLIAITAVPAVAADAVAADAAPVSRLKFSGWVDTILGVTDDGTEDDVSGPSAKDESATAVRFSAFGSIKAQYAVTDRLTSRINLWVQPDSGQGNDLAVREAWFAYTVADDLSWTMGKYINHLGWIAAEPTGLFRVNDSTIGYTGIYGNDVIGTSLGYAPDGSPVSGSFHITNGYFSLLDANNGDPANFRENTDLGFGLDVIIAVGDTVSVNLEAAYDMRSGGSDFLDPTQQFNFSSPAFGEMGGDVLLVGANVTVKPIAALTLGAELMFVTVEENEMPGGGSLAGSDGERIQGMVMANYALGGTPIPMSVTGMVQVLDAEQDDDTSDAMEIALAVLTNPLDVPNFGLNYEVTYTMFESHVIFEDRDFDGFNFFLEGITTF